MSSGARSPARTEKTTRAGAVFTNSSFHDCEFGSPAGDSDFRKQENGDHGGWNASGCWRQLFSEVARALEADILSFPLMHQQQPAIGAGVIMSSHRSGPRAALRHPANCCHKKAWIKKEAACCLSRLARKNLADCTVLSRMYHCQIVGLLIEAILFDGYRCPMGTQ